MKNKTNVFAIIGLIISIIGASGIIGLILSIIGLVKSKTTNSGNGLSIAGIIISGIKLGIILLLILLFMIGTISLSDIDDEDFGYLGNKEFSLYSDVATGEEKESGFYDKYYDSEDESVLLQNMCMVINKEVVHEF